VETPIGHTLRSDRVSAWLAFMVAAAAIVADLWLSTRPAYCENSRMVVAVIAVVLVTVLCHGDRASLGVSHRMLPTYRYWAGVTLVLGAVVGLLCVAGAALLHSVGIHIPLPATAPSRILAEGVRMCVTAPLLEESIYRLVLCVPLAAIAGPKFTILAAGAVFSGLHFAYGNPAPDNFVAGFFLTWAFLKSGSLLTPLMLHSLGNACALAAHAIHWQLVS
jgi:uncharacterized protein